MSKLILSTKKSLHEPIEIEVDGKTYQNRLLSRTLFEELKIYEKPATEGDVSALYKQIQIIFPIEDEVLNKLDVRDINNLLTFTMAKIFSPDKGKEEGKKKAISPGSKK